MSYNVFHEPWIPVRDKNGCIQHLGIWELFRQAQDLKEITDPMPHYEYGIYRLLFTMLMDIYQPERESDIVELLSAGRFDMDKVSAYIERCNENGERFDLFDEKHPFMQCGADQWSDGTKLKSAANLNPVLPSGNNHIHFNHSLEADTALDIPEAVKALCSINIFSTSGAQGYPSTPSGAPPVYSIAVGSCLFETLVYGMVPGRKYEHYADIPPYWRWNGETEAKKEVAGTSLLFGLTFPCRRIRLLENGNGKISSVYFEQGMNYVNYPAWEDPYVTYYHTKENVRANIKPIMDKESWRNLGSILDNRGSKAGTYVVKQYFSITENDKIHLNTYEVPTKKAAYLDIRKGEYVLPTRLVENQAVFSVVQEALESAEASARGLRVVVKELQKELGQDEKNGSMTAERERAVRRFLGKAKQHFFDWFCPELEKASMEEAEPDACDNCMKQWKKTMQNFKWDEYDNFIERIGVSAKVLFKAESVKLNHQGKEN